MNRRFGWGAVLLVTLVVAFLGVRHFRRAADTHTETGDDTDAGAAEAHGTFEEGPAEASIAGKVTDPDAKPIAGALVCAFAASDRLVSADIRAPRCATTDAAGRYRIEALRVARYAVNASAPQYQPARWRNPEKGKQALELKVGEARENIDLVLLPGGVEVRGRVKDISGGAVAGALVMVSNDDSFDGPNRAVTESKGEGEWQVWVAPGRITASATAEGYADGSKDGIAPGQFIEIALTPESVLQGRVVEVGTDTPVAGARVSASAGGFFFGPGGGDHSALTDEEGRFRIAHLEPGRYKPEARNPHRWGIAAESVLLGLGETSSELRIEVHPAATVSGRIAFDDNRGCAQGNVQLVEPSTGERRMATADEDGNARVEGLLNGTYQVEISCRDAALEDKYQPVKVAEKDVEQLVWKVTAGFTVSGQVTDSSGQPVASANVFARTRIGGAADPRSRSVWGNAESEKDGTFHLRGLSAATYNIDVRREGLASLKDPIEVKVDRNVDGLRVTLPSAGSIEGTVVDGSGAPVAAVSVQARGSSYAWNQSSTRDDGTFTLKGLNPGDYRVWASERGTMDRMRAPGTKDDDAQGISATVKAGDTARVKITVESQRGEIKGRVLDEDKQPVTDAFIDAERESDSASNVQGKAARNMRWEWRRSPVLADMDGKFTLSKLAPGTYTVRAYRKGGGESVAEKVRVGSQITLAIAAGASIAGTVVGPKGSAPERFVVAVRDAKAGFSRQETFFRTGGTFTLRDLPTGDFQVSADAAEGRAVAPVQLAQGEKRQGLRLELEGSASVRGRIVGLETGQPVAGMTVFVMPAKGASPTMMGPMDNGDRKNVTDADGRFEIEHCPAGRVNVMAYPKDYRSSEYSFVYMPATIESGRTNDLPPFRVPRKRIKGLEVSGDLGFGTQELLPDTDLEQAKVVVSVVRPGGPAAKAGLAAGDEIVSVDGQDITGANYYLYNAMTRIGEGTSVTLGVRRGATIVIQAGKPI